MTKFCCFIWILWSLSAHAENMSLELKQVNLTEAIMHLGKFLKRNIIVSQAITGVTSLHLHNAKPESAFDLLLQAHGLAKWQIGEVWFIAPQDELIKQKQKDLQWREVMNDSLPLHPFIRKIKFANAHDIAQMLTNGNVSALSKKGSIRADMRTNMLYIYDDLQHIKQIKHFVEHIDVPSKQILIKTRLASVDNDYERELGIQFNAVSADHNEQISTPNSSHHFSFFSAKLPNDSLLDVKLSALEKAGHAEIISSPSLFTANQLPASIEAGEEIPYQEIAENGAATVTFKKAVLGLKVTPQVLPGNKVLLKLQINQDRPNNKMVLGVPMISTRQIITTVLVNNGQTLVLGGIFEMTQEKGEQYIPILHHIPIIGLLFTKQVVKKMKRQLLIFVTPKIID
jgi:type IV pilus assembly protein PilQ